MKVTRSSVANVDKFKRALGGPTKKEARPSDYRAPSASPFEWRIIGWCFVTELWSCVWSSRSKRATSSSCRCSLVRPKSIAGKRNT